MDARLQMALQLLNAIPALIAAGANITTLVQQHAAKLKEMVDAGRDPTAEEWDDMNRQVDALRGQLHRGD